MAENLDLTLVRMMGERLERFGVEGVLRSELLRGMWEGAGGEQRAVVLTRLAWRARGAEVRHRATHDASRLALWAVREAAAWHASPALADVAFRLPCGQLARIPAGVQWEAAVRLLVAVRSGVLPPAPWRCAVCGIERDLQVRSYECGSGPGRDELRCVVCAGLPADPEEIPEAVDARWRRLPRGPAESC
ncbi:hypothetical protein [Streptomyces sp. 891-h]|uniref:hypothetical protein n=1 Tax=Streptomyces sp. 891-h TaxID=2720714 RepID=UPI001FAAB17D|nr:hypothetical protein [Streptomyces sp. 891-h]UNZ18241.1 hypothetical protein HC362_15530 [Streptomyces sp. 891-h]